MQFNRFDFSDSIIQFISKQRDNTALNFLIIIYKLITRN